VFLKREDGIVLRVPLRATNLSTFVEPTPRVKLSRSAVSEFLALVKEHELCPLMNTSPSASKRPPSRSGRRSKKTCDKKS
jgi:hypothetical protein